MKKIVTNEKLIDELLNRSVEEILPSKKKLKKELMSGRKLRIYIGTDPTGSSLHLGHATNYMILEKFRQLGHEVIFLIGDFTARIGDPTDKFSVRKQLTRQDVNKNVKTWLKQIEPIINFKSKTNPVKIKYNHDWLSKLTFENVVNLASNFTVQQMLKRDMFEKRIKEKKPIYLHEFFYPLMQGYDSVAMDVDIEMCGNDQKFNALVGRTLLKKIRNKEKFVFITNLLENPVTKEKMMSKSLGTGVFLDESSANMFGQIMAQADENILQLFTDCTYVPLEEIKKIKKQLKENKVNPRDIKMKLAFEITKIFHKEKEAQKAQEQFIKTVQKKEAPEEMPDLKVSKNASVVVAVVEAGLAQSNAEAKRKIKQGGVEIGGHKIMDINTKINSSMNGQVFKVGKRGFRKIQIN